MTFGEKVREFVEKHGEKEAARILDVSLPNIRRYAAGKVVPPAKELIERFIVEAGG